LTFVDTRTGLPVVGIVGAGQLARMTQPAAIALGVTLRVLAASPDDGAALVTADVQVGDHRSAADLGRFAKGCDVVTWDHEHVPNDLIAALAADGGDVQPGAAALRFAQDKIAMRTRVGELGLPNPRWVDLEASADPKADLAVFGEQVGWPLVLKAARGGYDGKGVWMIDSLDDAATLLASGTPLLAEERVPLARELAAVVARNPSGDLAAWPVVETVQRDGICVQVIAPAPALPSTRAAEAGQIAERIAAELGVTGVLATELFETTDGRLLVNELAMRPHNSAHWTIEGARTSQFEQHLRAVLDLPLGATTPTAPVSVMTNVLGGPEDAERSDLNRRLALVMRRWPAVKVHLYGKEWRPGRKVGHVTALGDDLDEVRAVSSAAADLLSLGDTKGTT
jgi:5-(carboxyamino)imidazole ribonucleotide synthase